MGQCAICGQTIYHGEKIFRGVSMSFVGDDILDTEAIGDDLVQIHQKCLENPPEATERPYRAVSEGKAQEVIRSDALELFEGVF